MGWFGVPVTESTEPTTGFRPRVGMGWFNKIINTETHEITFSSPLGDGLVQQKHIHIKHIIQIFVPEWGWVGSECREDDESFKKFLSPLGDGVVLIF